MFGTEVTSAPSSIEMLTSTPCKMITCAEVNEIFQNLCRKSCVEVRLPGWWTMNRHIHIWSWLKVTILKLKVYDHLTRIIYFQTKHNIFSANDRILSVNDRILYLSWLLFRYTATQSFSKLWLPNWPMERLWSIAYIGYIGYIMYRLYSIAYIDI